jgi:hypothetical protein
VYSETLFAIRNSLSDKSYNKKTTKLKKVEYSKATRSRVAKGVEKQIFALTKVNTATKRKTIESSIVES